MKRKNLVAIVLSTASLLLAAACSSGSSSGGTGGSGGDAVKGGTAVYAFDAGAGANYILPLESPEFATQSNAADFYQLMWRPLFWFGVDGGSDLNTDLSLADRPEFSKDGKTVTVTLKDYKWSDGTPVTTRDVEFWDNLVKFNKESFSSYTPGNYPDNVVSEKVLSPTQMSYTFDKAYNQDWLLYNQLSLIVPLPQQAWDKTSADGKVGDYDETASGAKAVYKFLDGQAKKLSSYAKNPLWQTVDGPWHLTAFDTNGNFTMKPNAGYSGPVKPQLEAFEERSYTDTAAEFNALKSGDGPDFGFISNIQIPQQKVLDRLGYQRADEYNLVISYNVINFNNPTLGPVFKQTYIRQVLQQLQDQDGIDKTYFDDVAYPTCGPVPTQPKNSFASEYEKSCPYSYNPAKAAATLKAHGWSVVKGGVDTCIRPGTAADECGAGIPAGQKLEISYLYPTGGIAYPKSIAQEAADAAEVGVKLDLKPLPYNEMLSQSVLCKPSEPVCKWGMVATGWIFAPDFYPSGEVLFQTGAGDNTGGYSDPKADELIKATTLNTGQSPQEALDAYQNYLTDQIPVLWQPNTYGIQEIRTKLHGVTPFNIFGSLTPENWYFTE